MSTQWTGLLVGGLLPALFFGVAGVFMKAATQLGIGLGLYLLLMGTGVMSVGSAYLWFAPDKTISMQSGGYAFVMGIVWGLGILFVAVGLTRFAVPVSKIAPIYNLNTLITVLLGLWIFAEWRNVNPLYVAVGAIIILVGDILVANA